VSLAPCCLLADPIFCPSLYTGKNPKFLINYAAWKAVCLLYLVTVLVITLCGVGLMVNALLLAGSFGSGEPWYTGTRRYQCCEALPLVSDLAWVILLVHYPLFCLLYCLAWLFFHLLVRLIVSEWVSFADLLGLVLICGELLCLTPFFWFIGSLLSLLVCILWMYCEVWLGVFCWYGTVLPLLSVTLTVLVPIPITVISSVLVPLEGSIWADLASCSDSVFTCSVWFVGCCICLACLVDLFLDVLLTAGY
jgi:hypothetical protein